MSDEQTVKLRVSGDAGGAATFAKDAKAQISGIGDAAEQASAKTTAALNKAQASLENVARGAGVAGNATQHLGDQQDQLARQFDRSAESGSKMGLIVGAAISAAAVGYAALVGHAISAADDIYLVSQRLGVSTESLSVFTAEARQGGVDVNQFNGALGLFSNAIARAGGGAKIQSQLFADMGISVRDASGHIKSIEQLLPEVADKFASYKDGPDKAALANKLFGESGSALIPMLNDLGDKGFAKVREEAEKMGLVIDQNTAKAAHELNDQITALKLVTEGYFNTVARDVLPNLVLFAQGLADQAKAAGDANDKTTVLGNGIRGLVTWLIEAYGWAQRFGVGLADAVARAGLEVDKLTTKMSDPGYREALGSALTGNPQAMGAVRAMDATIDQRFAPKTAALDKAADDSFSRIDKTVADAVANINKNIATMGDTAAGAGEKMRAGAAPVAAYGAAAKTMGDGGLAAANALQQLENFAGSLATKIGGPLEQAQAKYNQDVERANDLAEKAVIAGADLNKVIAAQNVALDNATKAYAKNLAQIALHNEKLKERPYEKLRGDLADYIDKQGTEIDQLEAEIAAGGDLSIMQQTDLDLREKLKNASDENRKALEAETDTIRKQAQAEQELQAVKGLSNDLSGIFNTANQSIANGGNAFRSLSNAAVPALQSIGNQITKIIAANTDATSGTVDWGKAIDGLGKSVKGALPALGQLVGTIAGGGGTGAQTGAAIGSVVGGVIGAVIAGAASWGMGAAGGYAIGSAIGGVVGGVAGGQGDGNGPPAVYVGSGADRNGGTTSGPLGNISVDTDNLADDAFRTYEDTIKGFDIQLAALFDPSQLAAVDAALAGFSGKFSDITSLLQARFDVVLKALGPGIDDFVNSVATDLQGRVQALADVLTIKLDLGNGGGFGVSLEDTLGLITKFGAAGERVAQTYAGLSTSAANWDAAMQLMGYSMDGTRLEVVTFAAEVAKAAGGAQQAAALWSNYFKEFYGTAADAAANVIATRAHAADALKGLGLDADETMTQFRDDFAAALPHLTPDEVATWLAASKAITDATDAQQAYIDSLGQSQSDYASFIADLGAQGAGISTVSPFAATRLSIEKWEQDSIKQANALARAAGLQGAAESDLTLIHEIAAHRIAQAIQQLEDSTRDLVADFYGNGQSAQDAANGASSAIGGFSNAMTSAAQAAQSAAQLLLGAFSPLNDQDKLQYALGAYQRGLVNKEDVLQIGRRLYASSDQYTQLFDMLQNMPGGIAQPGAGGGYSGSSSSSGGGQSAADAERQHQSTAEQISQNIASIAQATGDSYAAIAQREGVQLADLASALGFSGDAFTQYLDTLKAQENAVPDSIGQSSDRIIAALYDIAGKPVPPGAGGTGHSGHGEPGSQDAGGPTPPGHSQHGAPGSDEADGIYTGGHEVRGAGDAADNNRSVYTPAGGSGADVTLTAVASSSSDMAATLRDVRAQLDTLLAATRSGNVNVVDAIREIVPAVEGVSETIESGPRTGSVYDRRRNVPA